MMIIIFTIIDFKIKITTNLTEVNFLDITFDLEWNEILTDRTKNQMIN